MDRSRQLSVLPKAFGQPYEVLIRFLIPLSICEYCQKIFLGSEDEDRQLRPLLELKTSRQLRCPLCVYFQRHIHFKPSLAKVVFSFHHYYETDVILPLWLGTPRLPILELREIPRSGAAAQPCVFRAFAFKGNIWYLGAY
jgi:hypothetical protein